jgi:hypothetical protein
METLNQVDSAWSLIKWDRDPGIDLRAHKDRWGNETTGLVRVTTHCQSVTAVMETLNRVDSAWSLIKWDRDPGIDLRAHKDRWGNETTGLVRVTTHCQSVREG